VEQKSGLMEKMVNYNCFDNIYKGKTVLVTGHTGFKGSWLSIWLNELGAKVVGLSLDPFTDKDNFVLSNLSSKITDIRGDIRNFETVQNVFNTHKPDIVFHLAAQPLVRYSYENPIETYQVNVMGSLHILEAFRKSQTCHTGILITTDKCYDNIEQLWGYKETDPMGGHDPYSSSKGANEIAIQSYRKSYFDPSQYNEHKKAIASVRAGNVIGGGDWALDRIIPDFYRACERQQYLEIRSPNAIRPWQHVLEPLFGYLLLGQKLQEEPMNFAEGWNFGPEFEMMNTVWDIINILSQKAHFSKIMDVSEKMQLHEAQLLTLDSTKAKIKLKWHPKLDLDATLELTHQWYCNYQKEDVYDLCVNQIQSFLRS
jgi:CDP-glucose 4,6-dehydratase